MHACMHEESQVYCMIIYHSTKLIYIQNLFIEVFLLLTVVLPIYGSRFGQRLQAMEYGGLSCRGSETSLLHCGFSRSFVETWSKLFFSNQRDYAGVRCLPRKQGENKQALYYALRILSS